MQQGNVLPPRPAPPVSVPAAASSLPAILKKKAPKKKSVCFKALNGACDRPNCKYSHDPADIAEYKSRGAPRVETAVAKTESAVGNPGTTLKLDSVVHFFTVIDGKNTVLCHGSLVSNRVVAPLHVARQVVEENLRALLVASSRAPLEFTLGKNYKQVAGSDLCVFDSVVSVSTTAHLKELAEPDPRSEVTAQVADVAWSNDVPKLTVRVGTGSMTTSTVVSGVKGPVHGYFVDTAPGDSGSLILQKGKIVGWHCAGGPDATQNYFCPVSPALLEHLRKN